MSAYDIRPGGSLKLKGGVAEGGIVKKKKKKSKPKVDFEKNEDREKVKKLLFSEDKSSESPSGSGSNSPAPSGSSSRKTEAEKRFEEAQKRRLAERVAKLASKTHKERVSDFNKQLESLSEHHDIPKPTPFRSLATQSKFPIIPASQDDVALVSFFDRPSSTFLRSPFSTTGLFGYPSLTHPDALISLADSTFVHAQLLIDRILRARESRDELLKVVKNLDRLSNMLCGVTDLSEFIRNAHPDPMWVRAGEHAYETLSEFMHTLNTHVGLYEVLKAVLTDPSIVSTLSPEAYKTALIFWVDFEKSAIDLPSDQRNKFVSLSSELQILGRKFQHEANSARPPTAIKPSELSGLKDNGMGVRLQLQAQVTQRDLLVYPGSLQAQMIMCSAPEEEPRRRLYIAANSSTPEQIQLLEKLLRTRGELANLVGKESYAAMALGETMAKTPANVLNFLNALMDHTRPFAQRALEALQARKRAHQGTSTLPTLQAWDRDFYCPAEAPAPPIPLPPLTVGTVFMGLSRLFRHLYGISLRPADAASGDVWHPDVRKLEVVDEEKGIVGWIYADLFARRGKPAGAAHYTVRCSRRIDNDDEVGDRNPAGQESRILESQHFEAVKRHRVPGQDGVYQLPVVALVCDFARPSITRGPTVLEWHEVTTLFHEMGHAMHCESTLSPEL
ncbi:Mitochondrial intermediate peptidase [Termitomyces sp. T32_za158]|nr:Mitochondrial intermediate peptidase [Termitomyces sp. T32_za158]